MRPRQISVKNLCLFVALGALLSMLGVTVLFFVMTGSMVVLSAGAALMACALFWLFVLTAAFGKQLSFFSDGLCETLDNMINGRVDLQENFDKELLFDRISHRLFRLYEILLEAKHKVDSERREIQALVSDISHQVKTPVSNLKMVSDTLLSREVSPKERQAFLQGMQGQAQKLDFLVQALVKTSRLETGMVRLKKQEGLLFDTLAQAVGGIVYAAKRKGIDVSVDCPQELKLFHDARWTAEALFNLLDNAVKYTPAGGRICVSVKDWELYVRVDVSDTGKGIAESRQAAVFGRFYREQEVHDVHDVQGVGIGLYLAREIVTRQGGYIKLTSAVGEGSTFSVFLPFR